MITATPLERAYEVDFASPGWQDDWTVFYGTAVITPDALEGGGEIIEAHLGRAVDPRLLRITYTATMRAAGDDGRLSDLSCHVGEICFAFGGRLNHFTGITTPTQSAGGADGPLIEVGKVHEVVCEIRDRQCTLTVDGELAAELELPDPPTARDVRLYSWTGKPRFETLAIDTPSGQPPLPLDETLAKREAQRIRYNASSLQWIEHRGKFLHECTLPGEGRDVGFHPAHPNGLQLSKDRFLLLYSTRAYAGNDDERSGVYQVRKGSYDGPVLSEGWIVKSRTDWDPLGDGKQYVLQNGHPTAFGVPKGALINGKRVAHENVFGVIWRHEARWIDPATGFMADVRELPDLKRATQGVMWMQFRLNDAGDDIEIIEPAAPMRMVGYEEGDAFCDQPNVQRMNAGFISAQPINDDCSQWAHCNTAAFVDPKADTTGWAHDYGGVAPLRLKFNAQRGRYEWTELGPVIGDGTFEASVVPYRGSFLVAARRGKGDGIMWARMDDLFGESPRTVVVPPRNNAPFGAFLCPDGVVRRTGGRGDLSPYRQQRDPTYLVDVDPDNGFAESNARVIYDAHAAHVPIATGPLVDFGKILPHAGGKEQFILHRLRSAALNDPANPRISLPAIDIEVSGIYGAKIHYRDEMPGVWTFA